MATEFEPLLHNRHHYHHQPQLHHHHQHHQHSHYLQSNPQSSSSARPGSSAEISTTMIPILRNSRRRRRNDNNQHPSETFNAEASDVSTHALPAASHLSYLPFDSPSARPAPASLPLVTEAHLHSSINSTMSLSHEQQSQQLPNSLSFSSSIPVSITLSHDQQARKQLHRLVKSLRSTSSTPSSTHTSSQPAPSLSPSRSRYSHRNLTGCPPRITVPATIRSSTPSPPITTYSSFSDLNIAHLPLQSPDTPTQTSMPPDAETGQAAPSSAPSNETTPLLGSAGGGGGGMAGFFSRNQSLFDSSASPLTGESSGSGGRSPSPSQPSMLQGLFSGADSDTEEAESCCSLIPCLLVVVGMILAVASLWPLFPKTSVQIITVAGSERHLVPISTYWFSQVEIEAMAAIPLPSQPSINTMDTTPIPSDDTTTPFPSDSSDVDDRGLAVSAYLFPTGVLPPLTHRITTNRTLKLNMRYPDMEHPLASPFSAMRWEMLPGSNVTVTWDFDDMWWNGGGMGSPTLLVLRSTSAFRIWRSGLTPPVHLRMAYLVNLEKGSFTLTGVPADVYYFVFLIPQLAWRSNSAIGTVHYSLNLLTYSLDDPNNQPISKCLIHATHPSSPSSPSPSVLPRCLFKLPDAPASNSDIPFPIHILLVPPEAPSGTSGGSGAGRSIPIPSSPSTPPPSLLTPQDPTFTTDEEGTLDPSSIHFTLTILPREASWTAFWPLWSLLAVLGISLGVVVAMGIVGCLLGTVAYLWALATNTTNNHSSGYVDEQIPVLAGWDGRRYGSEGEPLPVYLPPESPPPGIEVTRVGLVDPPPYAEEDPSG
ncbi:hypothetical protein BC829DRAFT_391560 [Chytridium lagenaria]|nr:hypothetical protein BC829DRAFT_391560 [Chytridium lagenaria]